jgi:hypothetical protein
MAKHDELLQQGPRQAPDPETAEQRSTRVGWGAAGGGVLAGGLAAAKFGGLAKVLVWLFAFDAFNVWRLGGWIGLAVILAALAAFLIARRESGEHR